MVRLLLEAGATVDLQNKDGTAPLIFAAERGHIGLVRLLLQHSAEVDLASGDGATINVHSGATPLHRACHAGHVGVACLLLRSGAAVNAQCKQGNSALQDACYDAHTHVVRLLMTRR